MTSPHLTPTSSRPHPGGVKPPPHPDLYRRGEGEVVDLGCGLSRLELDGVRSMRDRLLSRSLRQTGKGVR